MAHFVQAISRYGPRLLVGEAAGSDVLSARIASVGDLDRNAVVLVLQAFDSALLHYIEVGTPVLLPGVGRFAPSIRMDGRIRLTYRSDRVVAEVLNSAGGYRGTIRNRGNIGLSPQDYKRIWDADHPDDPLQLSPC